MSHSSHAAREATQARNNFARVSKELADTLALLSTIPARSGDSFIPEINGDRRLALLGGATATSPAFIDAINLLDEMSKLALKN